METEYTERRYSDCTQLDRFLREYSGKNEVIVIDTETTGLYPTDMVGGHERKNYILQLSIISAHTGHKIYDGYFRPLIKSWPKAEAVNHIGYDMVKDKPRYKAEAAKIQKIIDRARVIIGYNVMFDVGFMERAGTIFREYHQYIDVMEDYAVWAGALHEYFHTFTWRSLVTAANTSKFDWAKLPPHNSLSDCAATLHVAKWLQWQHKAKGWVPYYPPCFGYEEKFYCSECKEPCRIRDRKRLCLATTSGSDQLC